jgi:cellulose biosynthesis protein BcsQ
MGHFVDTALDRGTRPPPTLRLGLNLPTPEQLRELAAGYHLCLVDCPAGAEAPTRIALEAADLTLLPCGPTAPDVWALGSTLDLLAQARRSGATTRAAVVLVRVDRQQDGAQLREVLHGTGVPLLRGDLRHDDLLPRCLEQGAFVHTEHPRAAASRELDALWAEVGGLSAACH